SLDETAEATLTIVATATSTAAQVNTAVKTQTEPDFNTANDRSSVTLNGAGTADLAVAKTVSAALRAVGEEVTFTVVVTNNGPETASTVAIADTLPAGLTFVSSSASAGSYSPGT